MHILIHTPRVHMGSSRWQTSLYHLSLVHLQILFLTRVYELPIHGSILQMTEQCPEFKLGIQKPHPVTSCAEEMTSKLLAKMLMSVCVSVCSVFIWERFWKEIKPIIVFKLYQFELVILILKCSNQNTIFIWTSQSSSSKWMWLILSW